jgi:hypothetical protein
MNRILSLRFDPMAHTGWSAKLLITLCCLAGFTGVMLFSPQAPRASAAEYTHALEPGQRLYPGDILYSPSHAYRLIMQDDGNLVIYWNGKALWSSKGERSSSSQGMAIVRAAASKAGLPIASTPATKAERPVAETGLSDSTAPDSRSMPSTRERAYRVSPTTERATSGPPRGRGS